MVECAGAAAVRDGAGVDPDAAGAHGPGDGRTAAHAARGGLSDGRTHFHGDGLGIFGGLGSAGRGRRAGADPRSPRDEESGEFEARSRGANRRDGFSWLARAHFGLNNFGALRYGRRSAGRFAFRRTAEQGVENKSAPAS